MKLSLSDVSDGYLINSYAPGEFKIRGQICEGGVLVSADRLQTGWPVDSLATLTADHLRELLDWQPDIIVLGTGQRQMFPTGELLALVAEARVGFEVMDTPAACRTYNILLSEDRKVMAALMPV